MHKTAPEKKKGEISIFGKLSETCPICPLLLNTPPSY